MERRTEKGKKIIVGWYSNGKKREVKAQSSTCEEIRGLLPSQLENQEVQLIPPIAVRSRKYKSRKKQLTQLLPCDKLPHYLKWLLQISFHQCYRTFYVHETLHKEEKYKPWNCHQRLTFQYIQIAVEQFCWAELHHELVEASKHQNPSYHASSGMCQQSVQ